MKNILSCSISILVLLSGVISFAQVRPEISGVSSINATIGSPVTISGSNFGVNAIENVVYFGGVKAQITAANSTSLTANVPLGVNFQPITVTNLATRLTGFSGNPVMPGFSGGTNFGSKFNFPTGIEPTSVKIGDLDGDGKPDLISTNSTSNSISILRNTHNGLNQVSFNSKTDFLVQKYPSDVSLADFDGDGKLDLAVANSSEGTVTTYKNESTPGSFVFTNMRSFSTNRQPSSISVGDLNGDGKTDIVVCNGNDKTVSVLLNISNTSGFIPEIIPIDKTNGKSVGKSEQPYQNEMILGNIYFSNKLDFVVGNEPSNVVIEDLNGDGKPEIIVANFISSSFTVLTNTTTSGNLSFNSRIDFPTNVSPLSMKIGDVNLDGKRDIALSMIDGTIAIFKNTSSNNSIDFIPSINYSIGSVLSFSSSITMGDINGDRKPDLAISNKGTDVVSILINNSTVENISFESNINLNTENLPSSITIGDLNGDGRPDIAVANNKNNSISIFNQACNAYIEISAVGGQNVCTGTSVTFNSNYLNEGVNPNFRWKKNGVFISGANGTTYTASSINNGDQFSLEMTSYATCAVTPIVLSEQKVITVNPAALPTVSLNISNGSENGCAGSGISFSANVTNQGTAPVFQWKNKNQTISNVTGATYYSSNLSDKDSIYVIMTSNGTCISPAIVQSNAKVIKISPFPSIPSLTAEKLNICNGDKSIIIGSCPVITDSFRWTTSSFSASSASSIASSLPNSNGRTVSEPGVYQGYCESNFGCGTSSVSSITINQGPNCGNQSFLKVLPEKPIVCPNSSITLTASGCSGTVTWTGGPSQLTGPTAVFAPSVKTTYFVQCSTGGYSLIDIAVASPSLIVNSNIATGKETLKAANTIQSSKKIGDPNFTPAPYVIFEAGNSITLLPGFAVDKLSVFSASIKGCL